MSGLRGLRAVAGAGVACALGVAAWTQVERRMPILRRYVAYVDVDPQTPPLRVLQVADPHLYVGQEFLVDFIRGLAREDFDLVLATGDNLGSAAGFGLLVEAFEPLLGRPGAFVFGSNDYYSPRRKRWSSYLFGSSKPKVKRTDKDLPWREMAQLFSDAGWVNLNNQSDVLEVWPAGSGAGSGAEGSRSGGAGSDRAVVPVRVGLMGVDDPHIKRDRVPEVPANWGDSAMYRLGVTHAPYQRVLNEFVAAGAHAVFAGHTHGGQLCVPGFGALVTNSDLPRRFASGLHEWCFGGDSAVLHVSAGLGNSPFAPVRFACRPEASIVELRPRS